MLLYYITDRKQFPGTEADRRAALLARIAEAARSDVDYIQLREKDLEAGELAVLASQALRLIRENSNHTRLLINPRTDVALAVGADGVHLTSTDITAADARAIVATRKTEEERGKPFLIGVSCHSVSDVRVAESQGADFAVLAPIFEKPGTDAAAIGLASLRSACLRDNPDLRVEAGEPRRRIPVLALGGVTLENAAQCLAAGAAGVAGIRLFQTGHISKTIKLLRTSF